MIEEKCFVFCLHFDFVAFCIFFDIMYFLHLKFLQKTAFSLVKSGLALGSPGYLVVRLFGWFSPCRKRPNTRENGCWLPQSDHIQRWYTFPDQTRPFSSPPQKNISVFQIFSSFSFSVFLLLQKQIISFFKYSPPFLSPFFFSSAEKNIHFFFKYFPPFSFLPFLGI